MNWQEILDHYFGSFSRDEFVTELQYNWFLSIANILPSNKKKSQTV